MTSANEPQPDPMTPEPGHPGADSTEPAHGLEWAVGQISHAWGGQIEAILSVLHAGSEDLIAGLTGIHELQTQWEAAASESQLATVPPLSALSAALSAGSERALRGMQFVDRMSQMLEVLRRDLARLEQDVVHLRNADSRAVDAWLEELASHYTTEEQRLHHPTQVPSERAAGGQGVDFF